MGGFGSGNTDYRWNKRGTTDELRQIDIRRWRREGLLTPGASFSWSWTRDGKRLASISVDVARLVNGGDVPQHLALIYSCRREGAEWERVREVVPIDWTVPRYGGRRPWFTCPGVRAGVECGRRVALLYLGERYFLCRHCLDLAYDSTREIEPDRVVRKLVALRERLGGWLGLAYPFPDRLKWMHHRTYHRLFMRGYRLELRHHAHFEAKLARLTAVLDASETRRERMRRRVEGSERRGRDTSDRQR